MKTTLQQKAGFGSMVLFLIFMLCLSHKSMAQNQPPQKRLPAKVTITITDKQIMRLDSAMAVINQTIDSKRACDYINMSVAPIFQQVAQQMVVDSVKVQPKIKKP